MVWTRLGVRRSSATGALVFLMVGLVTLVTERPALALANDGPPVIGQEPSVPQVHAPTGGGAVRIYGEGLLDVTAVTIGGVSLAATDFRVVDSDLIIAQVPAAGSGILSPANDGFAHITVTDHQGTSTTDLDGDGAVDDQKCSSCVGGELGAIFYTDATLTLSPSTNLDAGESVTMTLDGHRAGTQGAWVFTELNPLVNFLEDAPPDPDTFPPGPGYGEVLTFVTPDANGDVSDTVTVKSTTSSTPFNDKDQDYDPNADCPVTQATADYGLDKCILGYSEFGMASVERLMSFSSDTPNVDPVPASPTLNLTLSSATDGSTVSVAGSNWNAAPHFGSDTATDDPGESAVIIEVCTSSLSTCTAASSPAASVSPTRYFDSGSDPDLQPVTGTFSGATLSGSFTVAGTSACTPNCVVRVRQQRYNIETNAPVAGSYIQATTPLTTSIPTNLAVNDTSVLEGNSGTRTATFTVTRSGNISGTSSVSYSTANGTATSGSDYTAVSPTTLNFAATETTKTVTVTVTGDTANEPDETFTLNLSGATGATIVDGSGTGTISNDDGLSYIEVDSVTATEGNAGTTTATFSITRDGNLTRTSSVTYVTANGTAVAGSDYTAVPSTTVSFAPGETTKSVTVTITGDTLQESDETFMLNLSPAGGATISDSSATATIADNDAAPTLTVNDVFVNEGNSGTTAATFTITRWGATGGTSTVTYATGQGVAPRATAGSDYTAVSATVLTFAAGEVSKTVSVNIIGDTTSESNENFRVNLSSPTGATIAETDSYAVATILNDDGTITAASPAISVNDVSTYEGDAGTTAVTFTITRTGNTSGTSSVTYATANGTAFSTNDDYTAIPATVLSFAATETTKTVTVNVIGDRRQESREDFKLNLSSPVGATISDTQGVATIFNEDTIYFSITDISVHEGNSGTTTAAFIVNRYGATETSTSVNYATANGSATAGSDYTAVPTTTLNFGVDETLKQVSVTVTGDTAVEANETFVVNLTIPSGVTITLADNQGVATIVNDD